MKRQQVDSDEVMNSKRALKLFFILWVVVYALALFDNIVIRGGLS